MKKKIFSFIAGLLLFNVNCNSQTGIIVEDIMKTFINVKSCKVDYNQDGVFKKEEEIKGPILFNFDFKTYSNNNLIDIRLIKKNLDKITTFNDVILYKVIYHKKTYYICVDNTGNKLFKIKISRKPKIEIYNLNLL